MQVKMYNAYNVSSYRYSYAGFHLAIKIWDVSAINEWVYFARKVPRNVFLGEFPHAYNFNKDQKQKFWWFDLVIYCDIMIMSNS